MNVNVVVVSHVSRDSSELQRFAQADHVVTDDGNLGCDRNHLRAWLWHAAHPAGWSVVLEDDAIPMGQDGFRAALDNALAVAPCPVVSLYLGRCHPRTWQTEIAAAVLDAIEVDANWIVTQHLYHAVGVAVRHDYVQDMVMSITAEMSIDERITDWVIANGLQVAYCWPSMVEHSDMETLVHHRDGQLHPRGSRVAWCAELRSQWTNKKVVMP